MPFTRPGESIPKKVERSQFKVLTPRKKKVVAFKSIETTPPKRVVKTPERVDLNRTMFFSPSDFESPPQRIVQDNNVKMYNGDVIYTPTQPFSNVTVNLPYQIQIPTSGQQYYLESVDSSIEQQIFDNNDIGYLDIDIRNEKGEILSFTADNAPTLQFIIETSFDDQSDGGGQLL
eukprot:Awhi_evm3s15282